MRPTNQTFAIYDRRGNRKIGGFASELLASKMFQADESHLFLVLPEVEAPLMEQVQAVIASATRKMV